ncbi:MAG: hypothetical protein RL392_1934 [Pseudomonadota bacterium]|jgi:hypothetical protein
MSEKTYSKPEAIDYFKKEFSSRAQLSPHDAQVTSTDEGILIHFVVTTDSGRVLELNKVATEKQWSTKTAMDSILSVIQNAHIPPEQ